MKQELLLDYATDIADALDYVEESWLGAKGGRLSGKFGMSLPV